MSPLHHLLFIVFSLDMFVHAPIPIKGGKECALALAIVAAFSQSSAFLVASELCWVALLVSVQTTPTVVDTPVQEDAEDEDQKDNHLHESLVQRMQQSLDTLVKNLGDVNADGKPWKLQAEDEANGIRVFNSEFTGKSVKRWKAEVLIKGPTLDQFVDEVLNYEKRCGGETGKANNGGWDNALKAGKVLHEFEDKVHSISISSAHPAGGGAISSRQFVDLRAVHTSASSSHAPEGGLVITMCGLTEKDKKLLPVFPKPAKGIVRGFNFAGTGMRISPLEGENCFKFEIVSNLDLKGWIPTSIINTATCSALVDSNRAMLDHLKKAIPASN